MSITIRKLLKLAPVGLAAAGLAVLPACSFPETRSVTLRWLAPTKNEDGSELDNLAGYRVYWRQSGSAARNLVEIEDPSVTFFEIEDLSSGEWRAGVTAYTEDEQESDLATVTFVIDGGEVSIEESSVGRIVSREDFDAGEQGAPSVALGSEESATTDGNPRPE